MNHPNGDPGASEPESERREVSIGEKELMSMLAEMRDSEATVAGIIEEALQAPIPDLNDPEAVEAFNQKMAMLKELAPVYVARSELLLDFQARIEEKIRQSQDRG